MLTFGELSVSSRPVRSFGVLGQLLDNVLGLRLSCDVVEVCERVAAYGGQVPTEIESSSRRTVVKASRVP